MKVYAFYASCLIIGNDQMTNIHNHLNWLSLPSSFLTPRLPAAAAAAAAELLLELDSRLPVLPLPAPHIHALPLDSESLHCKTHARIIKCPSSSAFCIMDIC